MDRKVACVVETGIRQNNYFCHCICITLSCCIIPLQCYAVGWMTGRASDCTKSCLSTALHFDPRLWIRHLHCCTCTGIV